MSIGDKNNSRFSDTYGPDSYGADSFDVVYGVDSLATPAPKPEPEPEPEPEPVPEPRRAHASAPAPEPEPEPEPAPAPEPEPEPAPMPTAEPIPDAEVEQIPEPEPEPMTEVLPEAAVEVLDADGNVTETTAEPEGESNVEAEAAADTEDEDLESQVALENLRKAREEKERKKRIKIIAGAAVGAGLLAVVLGGIFGKKPEPEVNIAPEVVPVVRGNYENAINANGGLKAGSTVVVTPEVDGTIEQVMVKEGQKVKKDDLLFTIKNDKLDKAIRDAEDELADANNAVTKAQAQVEAANRAKTEAWDRYNETVARNEQSAATARENYETAYAEWQSQRQSIAAEYDDKISKETDADKKAALQEEKEEKLAELDAKEPVAPASNEPTYTERPSDSQLDASVQDAQYAVQEAQQAVTRKQKALDDAKAEGEKRQVKAPAAGNVVALGAKVGQAVTVGSSGAQGQNQSSGPLVQIDDMSQMTIDVEVNEIDIMSIKRGMPAKATFSAVPGVEVDATVSEVATVASSAQGGQGGEGGSGQGVVTFHVGLTVPRPNDKLRAGMTANVRILTSSVKDCIVIPSDAIAQDASGYNVQVVVNPEDLTQTETRSIQIGEHNDLQTVVKEGLVEGEQLVVTADAGATEDAVDEAAARG